MPTRHERFSDWANNPKAKANLNKHGVSFDLAALVLADPWFERFHIESADIAHSSLEEQRYITIGSWPENRDLILAISWTSRYVDTNVAVTRIISARKATKKERKEYEQEIF